MIKWFFAFLLLNIVAGITELEILSYISKPLLMPLLVLYVLKNQLNSKYKNLLLCALFFSWLGDCFLMFSGEMYFMMGLGSFLMAHVFYLLIFRQQLSFHPLKLLPFLAFAALMLFGVLGDAIPAGLKWPVYVYMMVILCMAWFSSMRKSGNAQNDTIVLIGAVLFVLSDSFIAINQFKQPVALASFWVMSTYGVGQLLIVKGLISQDAAVE